MEVLDGFMRTLMGGAAPTKSISNGFGPTQATPTMNELGQECYCIDYLSHGSKFEKTMMLVCCWATFAISVAILIFYAFHSWKATCGWEEVYVCVVELIKVVLEIFVEKYTPATLTQVNGVRTLWLRYGEWLLTCPVILIHLSNITGLNEEYSKRTMSLLVSDIGTIVMGATSAMSRSPTKIVFFIIGCCYSANTFFHAAKIYVEAYHMVPKGTCRMLIKFMAWCFFTSWIMFPLLFLMGPEGFGHLSPYASVISHTFADVLSKNLWGLLGHFLRVKIHEHILVHGDIRVKTKVKVAGEEMEIDTFVEDENIEGAVKHSTAALAKRGSFLVMRDNMKARGVDVRASLEGSPGSYGMADPMATMGGMGGDMMGAMAMITAKPTMGGKGMGLPTAATTMGGLEPGRVILGVLDASMVDYFKEQFASLPVPVDLVPALGADAVLSVAAQAAAFGGADCVLLHPEYLKDRSMNGVVARLKASGNRVAAFGWAPAGPMRELIESSGLDGWLEGPSWGMPINPQQLTALLGQMQAQRRSAASFGATMGAGVGSQATLGRSYSAMSPTQGPAAGFGGRASPGMMGGGMFGSGAPAAAPAAPAAAPAGGASDAEMLQQLMAEIGRLKNELGEN